MIKTSIKTAVMWVCLLGTSICFGQSNEQRTYDQISAFGTHGPSDWALVERNGLYGFVDISGREVVPIKYDSLFAFGAYHSQWAMAVRNGKRLFINRQGFEVLTLTGRYDAMNAFGTHGPRDWALVKRNGLYGFVDISGREVVPVKYDSLFAFGAYHSQWAMAVRNGKRLFINRQGFEVLTLTGRYDAMNAFGTHGPSNWALVERDGLCGFVDISGRVVIPLVYDKIGAFGAYHSNWALVSYNGKFGLINKYGTPILKRWYHSKKRMAKKVERILRKA